MSGRHVGPRKSRRMRRYDAVLAEARAADDAVAAACPACRALGKFCPDHAGVRGPDGVRGEDGVTPDNYWPFSTTRR